MPQPQAPLIEWGPLFDMFKDAPQTVQPVSIPQPSYTPSASSFVPTFIQPYIPVSSKRAKPAKEDMTPIYFGVGVLALGAMALAFVGMRK